MLELYNYKLSTCSQKVRLCLAEKQLDWTDREIDLTRAQQLSPEYLELNPNGVVPTLVHDGQVITDSSVIIEYLDEVFPTSGTALAPADPVARAGMRAWLRYIEEVPTVSIRYPSFNRLFLRAYKDLPEEEFRALADRSPLRKYFLHAMGQGGFSQEQEQAALERLGQTVQRAERALQQGEWICGEQFTMADICLTPTIVRLEDMQLDTLWSDAPAFADWYARIKARPSFDQAFYPGSRIDIAAFRVALTT
jgi:glutathione S-transferase